MSKGKSFHPTGKFEQNIEDGSSAFGTMCCFILAGIVVIWLCQSTSAGLTTSIKQSHYNPFRPASTLDLISEWF